MKSSYVDELGLLASSYAWASREDISLSFLTQLRQGLLYISGVVARWQFLLWPRLFMLRRLDGLQLMDAFSGFRWTTEALHSSSPLFSARAIQTSRWRRARL